MSYYDILGVSPTASQAEIKEAYRNLIKAFHPDLYAGKEGFAKEKTTQIIEAYQVLKDEALREQYDDTLYRAKADSQSGESQTASSAPQSEPQQPSAPRRLSPANKILIAVVMILLAALIALGVYTTNLHKSYSNLNGDTFNPVEEKLQHNPSSRKYIASVKSDKFHRLSCTYAEKISTQNETWYTLRSDAISDGKTPCPTCRP